MAMTKDQILSEAMALGPDEREALAEELWLSLNGERQKEVDAAWLEEVRRRDAAFAAGEVQASDLDDVMARLLARGRR
jgi:putative addiction module component (TIGR02574 family)